MENYIKQDNCDPDEITNNVAGLLWIFPSTFMLKGVFLAAISRPNITGINGQVIIIFLVYTCLKIISIENTFQHIWWKDKFAGSPGECNHYYDDDDATGVLEVHVKKPINFEWKHMYSIFTYVGQAPLNKVSRFKDFQGYRSKPNVTGSSSSIICMHKRTT